MYFTRIFYAGTLQLTLINFLSAFILVTIKPNNNIGRQVHKIYFAIGYV